MRRRRPCSRRNLDLTVLVEDIQRVVQENAAVHVRGHRTRRPSATTGVAPAVFVEAPSGVVDFQPDEMTVRVGAGTPLSLLDDRLATANQFVDLPGEGTVGGALAQGHDGLLALGRGRMRDVVLGARFVDGEGRLVVAGGATVKNVSGFDLCRLLVGSRGVLGVLVDVVLRTRPRPLCTQWFVGEVADATDVRTVQASLHRPAALLWDSRRLWVCLEGHPDDVAEEGRSRLPGFSITDSAPETTDRHRFRFPPHEALGLASPRAIVEVGRGVVHSIDPLSEPRPDAVSIAISRRLKRSFDPANRLNPHLSGDWST